MTRAIVLATETTGIHGLASYYGNRFNGRRTATGERYQLNAFTGASNRFPLGSRVAVRRLDSERCAIVTINDRMHARHQQRVIDVSYSVARYLDMLRNGVVLVRVAPLQSLSRQGNCLDAFEVTDPCPDCQPEPRLPQLESLQIE